MFGDPFALEYKADLQ